MYSGKYKGFLLNGDEEDGRFWCGVFADANQFLSVQEYQGRTLDEAIDRAKCAIDNGDIHRPRKGWWPKLRADVVEDRSRSVVGSPADHMYSGKHKGFLLDGGKEGNYFWCGIRFNADQTLPVQEYQGRTLGEAIVRAKRAIDNGDIRRPRTRKSWWQRLKQEIVWFLTWDLERRE